MKQTLSDDMLAEVSRHIATKLGLHFPRSKWKSLQQALCNVAKTLGLPGPEECARGFVYTPTQELFDAMVTYLTVGETYFLRESRGLAIMEKELIPELIRTRHGEERRLRIWSAGCSTGEEPYTIAILLHRMGHLLRNWEISIMATDLNTHALNKAMEGVYTEWSFRNPPRWFKENYFRKTGDNRYELIPKIRRMVTFACLNLAENSYPSPLNNTNAMDMIFCRNVLMYLTPERANTVIKQLHHSLVEGGYLFVSPCETSALLASRFKTMHFTDAILYRKSAADSVVPVGATEPVAPPSPTPQSFPDVILPPPPPEQARATSPPAAPPAPLSPCEEASALYDQGCYAEATELLTLHLGEHGDDAAAMALLCRVHANAGRLGEALRLSEQALAADRLNAGMYYLHALILQEQGDLDRATSALKRALYLEHELVLAHYALGNLALRQGKEKESRRSFDNALALLKRYAPDETVPESGGMLAGRLMEMIRLTAGQIHHAARNSGNRVVDEPPAGRRLAG